jgi:hypothetical protein
MQPQPGAEPVITAFSATASGLLVDVSFTVQAQASRGPFTCSVRHAAAGTDRFPCSVGRVSRMYDYDTCCGSAIFVTAVDRHGVRSEQWNGVVEFPRPDPAKFEVTRGWYDGGTVFVEFDVMSAPGDDPRCDVRITGPGVYQHPDLPCEGATVVSLQGVPGIYIVDIGITSDSYPAPHIDFTSVVVE